MKPCGGTPPSTPTLPGPTSPLSALGFTEHSFPHVCRVAEVAGQVLKALGYDSHQIELAKIAAYLHDIGNLVNRVDHSQSGAVMAFRILDHMDMDAADVARWSPPSATTTRAPACR